MVEGSAGDAGRGVGHQRDREHPCSGRAGRDGLVDRGHADEVGAERAQHPDLRRCLVVGAGKTGVDPFGQRRIDLPGEGAQLRRVGVDEIDELGADQRGAAGEVEMVGDENGLTDGELGVDPARRIGEDDGAGTRRDRRAHGMDDTGEVVSLVGVDPAREDEDRVVAGAHRVDVPGMSFRRRRRESGQLAHRDRGDGDAETLDRGPPAGAEDDGDGVFGHSRPFGECGGCGIGGRGGVEDVIGCSHGIGP